MLRGTRLTPIVVVHANHANELDAHVAAALAKLSDAGIVLLNQAVLLARRERHGRGPGRALRTVGRPARDAVLFAPTRPRRRRGPLRGADRNRPANHRRAARRACPATPCRDTSPKLPGAEQNLMPEMISRKDAEVAKEGCTSKINSIHLSASLPFATSSIACSKPPW